MPNIAFLSLIYLLLAVPGFLVRSAYFSGEFTRNLLPRSWTDEIGKAILYSVPFHLLWVGLFELAQCLDITHHTLTTETVLRLMAAEYTSHDYSFHGIVSRLAENKTYLFFYYSGVVLTSISAGWGARRIVWMNELDVKWPWLRYRSEWLYKIMGRGGLKDVPWKDTESWIDILSEQDALEPGKAVLYRGLAAGYTTEDNGALRDVILTDVKRTIGKKDSNGCVVWTHVGGRFFVMSYSKVRNMNITYEQYSRKLLEQISDLSAESVPLGPEKESQNTSSSQ